MRYSLTAPHRIEADVQLPASKSISNRALIINALAADADEIPLLNLSDCDDTRVMLRALTADDDPIDILAAGTAMRFLTAYLCVTPGRWNITGTDRMRQRPIRVLVDALRELGACVTYAGNDGFPPLSIEGRRLRGGTLCLRGDVSSQYISALLMIGPTLVDGLTLRLTGDIVSRPYIDLTLRLMRDFGARAAWTGTDVISVAPLPYRPAAPQAHHSTDPQAHHSAVFTVESDWSAASYWYQIVALHPHAEVSLRGLFVDSYQGDSRGASLFARLGVATEFTPQGVRLRKTGAPPHRLDEDLVDIPDLAQTFVVACALLGVPFRFTGLQSLKIKETDRIAALRAELRKLGYLVNEENDNTLFWDGERCPAETSPVIRTYDDHRMAMSFAPAAIRFPSLRIADPQVVSKSYPAYWSDLERAGFRVEESE
ncbi:MAG: 3-phosphoshikimate 1-carboxyvinyltransferase [Mediterranea sp.]|jgi:3-phosphoshikimate 1-carboxyvinyltransferase|nr:3-phosphoshikimate 1-carboxyvinyltransferase [Mediterranea sp.]